MENVKIYFFRNKLISIINKLIVVVIVSVSFQVHANAFPLETQSISKFYNIKDDNLGGLISNKYNIQKIKENGLFAITNNVKVQKRVISGTVTDKDGKALPAVTVSVKGTSIGTITDKNGNFMLQIPENAEILVFSFVGMKTQEIRIDDRKSFNIVMEEEVTPLDQVVVVSFGKKKKINLTGAVGVVDTKTLESRPVQNISQALQGVVPGLNISYANGGSLNAQPNINIRGVGTISEGSYDKALVLIDGMEADLNTINPEDIKSISVLKDAAASSIYGSRAPFGVILITTKSGTKGKTIINYYNNFKFSSPILLPKMEDSYTFALYFNEASRNAGWGDVFSQERLQRIKDYQEGKITTTTIKEPYSNKWGDGYDYGNDNIDYYKVLYKDWAPSQEHNLSISGGKKDITYYISSNYLKQKGLLTYGGDGYDRFTINAKFNADMTHWLTMGYSSRFIRDNYFQPSHYRKQLLEDLARQIWPTKPLYDPNGNLFDDHVLGLINGGKLKTKNNWLYQQINIVITPVKDWRIVLETNYNLHNYYYQKTILPYYQLDINGNPGTMWDVNSSLTEGNSKNNFFNNNIYTDYQFTLGNKHKFKIMAGFQNESNLYQDIYASRLGLINRNLVSLNTTTGLSYYGHMTPPYVSGQYIEWTTVGFFGRIDYNYKSKYLAEFNLRYDGSSRFRETNRWGLFPSLSAGWNIAKENFFSILKNYINYLKLRGSVGALGNQNTTSVYPTYSVMGLGIASGDFIIKGMRPNVAWPAPLISSDLTWERIFSWNVGGDFGVLDNRLTGSFDYFTRFTRDMVGPVIELPAILGTNVPPANNTELKTWGFEYNMGWNDKLDNGLGYSFKLLISDSQTRILKYSNPTNSLTKYREGQLLGEIWGYVTLGIAKTQEEMDNHLASLPNGGQSPMGRDWKPGDIMYKDINGDGKIDWGQNTSDDPGDVTIIGNSTPRYSFGLDGTVNFKGFDFRVFFQGILKRDVFQDKYYFWGIDGGRGKWFSTMFVQHKDYFRDDPEHPLGLNLDGYYPRPLFGTKKNQQIQTRYLQDGRYIRLKNVQLGYTLPQHITKKAAISRLRIYVSGENLLTFTKMIKIFDPETVLGGYGGSVYPLSKVLSCGLSVDF